MAASSQGQHQSISVPLLERLTWSDTVLPLDVVLEQFHLPQIVKLADRNVPDFPGGAVVLLVSLREQNSRYVVARCMAGDKNRTMVGPWLSLPFSYKAKFMRMHNGEATKTDRFQGVKRLAQYLPSKVVATQEVSESTTPSVSRINAGEEIRCLGIEGVQAKASSNKQQYSSSLPWTLACLNENNEYVTLPLASSAIFLSVAGGAVKQSAEEQTIDKFSSESFPLTVLQTEGKTPAFCQDTFTGIFRLVQARDERMVFACSLRTGANGAVLYEFLELPARNSLAVVLAEGMLEDHVSYNWLLTECCEKLKVWTAKDKYTDNITRVLTRELYFKDKADATQRIPLIKTETPGEDEEHYVLPQSDPRDHQRPPTPPPLESLFALTLSRNRARSAGDISDKSGATGTEFPSSTRRTRSSASSHRRHSNQDNRRHSNQDDRRHSNQDDRRHSNQDDSGRRHDSTYQPLLSTYQPLMAPPLPDDNGTATAARGKEPKPKMKNTRKHDFDL